VGKDRALVGIRRKKGARWVKSSCSWRGKRGENCPWGKTVGWVAERGVCFASKRGNFHGGGGGGAVTNSSDRPLEKKKRFARNKDKNERGGGKTGFLGGTWQKKKKEKKTWEPGRGRVDEEGGEVLLEKKETNRERRGTGNLGEVRWRMKRFAPKVGNGQKSIKKRKKTQQKHLKKHLLLEVCLRGKEGVRGDCSRGRRGGKKKGKNCPRNTEYLSTGRWLCWLGWKGIKKFQKKKKKDLGHKRLQTEKVIKGGEKKKRWKGLRERGFHVHATTP